MCFRLQSSKTNLKMRERRRWSRPTKLLLKVTKLEKFDSRSENHCKLSKKTRPTSEACSENHFGRSIGTQKRSDEMKNHPLQLTQMDQQRMLITWDHRKKRSIFAPQSDVRGQLLAWTQKSATGLLVCLRPLTLHHRRSSLRTRRWFGKIWRRRYRPKYNRH